MQRKFKLTIELVPSTVWFSSLHKMMDGKNWEQLKSSVYVREGRKCWICASAQSPLELHEFWEYDDTNHIQRLVGMHHLCRLCHMIKHIGLWCHTAKGLKTLNRIGLTREDLVKHFCRVNNCAEEDFLHHEEKAFKTWRERSKSNWTQDFGEFEKYLKR